MLERALERLMFASRWLMAPFYLGLIVALIMLLYTFLLETAHFVADIHQMKETDVILMVLTLIDLSLAGNLVLIVIFSGYENFVSRIDVDDEDRPPWMGTVDFGGLKLKLIASIVAISGIHLLKSFMNVATTSPTDLRWMVTIHMVFVLSGVLLAVMDWVAGLAKTKTGKPPAL
ncbi:TIGR00645 family protein [Geminicoccus flavidas]|uniref:TIGR00645 family protein n=1 Tax=Geminicoccus flavidas TaxID=2506407 RepID=UPI00135ADE2B|nr:TIGR00645 family protein [Geminicoccus flavidas]